MIDIILEPLSYGFMQRGFITVVLCALICAVLSCWLVLLGWALLGDAISHAVLPGVVIAYLLGAPFIIGALIAALIAVTLIGWTRKNSRVGEDSAIGIVFTTLFAFGLVLISLNPSQIDLHGILFGNVLGVSSAEVLQVVILVAIVLMALWFKKKDLVLFAFDAQYAHVLGLKPKLLSSILLLMLALTSVVALKVVGVVLVAAMLVVPGAAARLLTRKFNTMLIIAVLVSVFSTVTGFYLSYYVDVSTGGMIVFLQGCIFFLIYIFAPRYGLLATAYGRG